MASAGANLSCSGTILPGIACYTCAAELSGFQTCIGPSSWLLGGILPETEQSTSFLISSLTMCSTYFSYMLPSSPTIPISWPTDTAQPFLHLIYFAVCRKGIVISYVYLILWFMWFCVSWMYPLVALWIHPMLHGCIHLLQHGHIHAIIWTHLDVSRHRHGCIHEPYF